MKLKKWLEMNGKDYKDLAKALNVDKSTICRYLNGSRRIPLEKAVKIEKLTRGEIKCRDLV